MQIHSDICSLVPQIIFAVIFPPLGVFLERGCGADLVSPHHPGDREILSPFLL